MSDGSIDRLNAALEGRYAIERELGQGGMATVYLADDLRHERKVALKVLKPELSAVLGAERFLAEIKTTANLQHPHILPLFDSGEADSNLFYVMPYVEGETLQERIDREKQLPVDEAVTITTALANALQTAHERGIVHRDIKPANILLRRGEPLLADFGIALAVGVAGGRRLTETGLSVGTPYYMSPEQATGDRDPDARSDIYSLACVLYEMLTGEPPFTGPTAQAVLARILSGEVTPPSEHRKTVPAGVESALLKALETLPADRFDSARSFTQALADPSFRYGAATMAGVTTGRSTSAWLKDWRSVAALLVAVAAVLGAFWSAISNNQPPVEPITFRAEAPPPYSLDVSDQSLAVSPDGRRIAYIAHAPGEAERVFVQNLDEAEAFEVSGTDSAVAVFFSPDGNWLGFVAGAGPSLKKIPVSGGVATILDEDLSTFSVGGTWMEDGRVLYLQHFRLWEVPADAGTPRPVSPSTLDGEAYTVVSVVVLPSQRAAVLDIVQGSEAPSIFAVDLESGEMTHLVSSARAVGFMDGYLLHARADGILVATPFDERALELVGAPVALPLDLGAALGRRWDATGDLFAFYEGGDPLTELVLIDREGSRTNVDAAPLKVWLFPRFSPDGAKIAAEIHEAGGHIWVYDLKSTTLSRLTSEGHNSRPAWSPDGSQLAYWRFGPPAAQIYYRPADASAPETLVPASTDRSGTMDWFPSGDRLAVSSGGDIWAMPLDGDTMVQPIIATPAVEYSGAISPDGRWIAYVSDETGVEEVYVRASDGGGARMPVSTDGAYAPSWAFEGTELFYQTSEGFESAKLEFEPEFRVEREHLFDETELIRWSGDPRYAVHPDGEHFLFVRPTDVTNLRIRMIVNFGEQLARWIAAGSG